MFDNFPQPCNGTNKVVTLVIKHVNTAKVIINGPGTLAHDSLHFSSSAINYKLESIPIEKIKYRRTIVFPLKYIKYFEIGEFFDYKDSLPRSYEFVFHADLSSDNEKSKKNGLL